MILSMELDTLGNAAVLLYQKRCNAVRKGHPVNEGHMLWLMNEPNISAQHITSLKRSMEFQGIFHKRERVR